MWVPCREKVAPGQYRCAECLSLLLGHPDPVVRRWMAEEKNQAQEVLELLATDLDFQVANAAKRALEEGQFG